MTKKVVLKQLVGLDIVGQDDKVTNIAFPTMRDYVKANKKAENNAAFNEAESHFEACSDTTRPFVIRNIHADLANSQFASLYRKISKVKTDGSNSYSIRQQIVLEARAKYNPKKFAQALKTNRINAEIMQSLVKHASPVEVKPVEVKK